MPDYRLKYNIETCLNLDRDIAFEVPGHRVALLFSLKKPNAQHVQAVLEVHAPSAWNAHNSAASFVLPRLLDALSFATGTPLFLQGHCKLILKDESHNPNRRAIYVESGRLMRPVRLTVQAMDETQRILRHEGAPTLPLRWLRYSSHRPWTLDKFVFTWLAFEELAGDADIETTCERCGATRTHRGADRRRAFEMLRNAGVAVTQQEFRERIWGKARNSILHGARDPDPTALRELHEMTRQLWEACDQELSSAYDLERRARLPIPLDIRQSMFVVVEWQTSNPAAQFPDDFPEHKVARILHEGTGFDRFEEEGLRLLPIDQADKW